MSITLPTLYQQFINSSRYARWLGNRRESWEETVDRYISFMCDERCKGKIDPETRKNMRNAILNCQVMPSMRAMMTAGPALRRDHMCAYNCTYVAIDDTKKFSEILYILMCGTGVGFSCERQIINKLPMIPELNKLHLDVDTSKISDSRIVVEDSKIGWSESFNDLIYSLYCGVIPEIDYSKIRPAGARLKTMGGRASGPEPLKRLFQFTIQLFQGACGRKLNSVEVHKLVCNIAEIVVVGGVRRSALLGLSNLSDDRMRDLKTGSWWETMPYLSMSNNSVAYTEKPEHHRFAKEWMALWESRCGERGIFNREAAKKQVEKNQRRDPNHEWGTNPCVTKDTWIMTGDGSKQVSELIGKKDLTCVVNGKAYPVESDGFFYTGTKDVVKVRTQHGRSVKTTMNHPFLYVNGEWTEIQHLLPGDEICISNHEDMSKLTDVIESITYIGQEDVYDVVVKDAHEFCGNGFRLHNCSEILLRPNECCNLTEVVIRFDDNREILKEKVRIATILGTMQSTLTDFLFVGPEWKKNCDEERLLGVSLTGIMDNPMMYDLSKKSELEYLLHDLKQVAIDTNKEWAIHLGINQSAAITCVKPSGTVSQLVDSASGIHPRWSKYYIRTVRCDKKDPIYQFLESQGISCEDEIFRPNSTAVFSFPIKSPDGSMTRSDLTSAIQQLELWKIYQEYWCEHKPSITVYVRDNEWMEVGTWVWKNFDSISGVSFLPYDNGSYQQAPYQEITESEYTEALKKIPTSIDWAGLSIFEIEETRRGMTEFNCIGNKCENVDI